MNLLVWFVQKFLFVQFVFLAVKLRAYTRFTHVHAWACVLEYPVEPLVGSVSIQPYVVS